MYDAIQYVRQGEKPLILASATAAPADTLTIQASPAPTFTLYDWTGAAVAGFTGLAVTGYQATALAAPEIWWQGDTSALTGTLYYGRFTFAVLDTAEAVTYLDEAEVQIVMQPAVEIAATYDPTQLATNLLYQTRFHAADTNTQIPIWSDVELNAQLVLWQNIPMLAAAAALRAAAADNAKLAVVTKIGQVSNDESRVSAALIAMAQELEKQAPVAPVVDSNDQIFSMDDSADAIVGTMDNW